MSIVRALRAPGRFGIGRESWVRWRHRRPQSGLRARQAARYNAGSWDTSRPDSTQEKTMQRSRLAVGALLILVSAVCAQQTPAPSGPANNMLDPTLTQWEKAMTGLQSFVAEVHRKKLDNVFKTTEKYSGIAKFVKGQRGETSRASLYLRKTEPRPAPNAPEIFERYVCTGNFLYVFDAPSKIIRYYEVVATKAGQISDDNFLGLLFGMRAEDMKKRYNMRYVPATDPEQATWHNLTQL